MHLLRAGKEMLFRLYVDPVYLLLFFSLLRVHLSYRGAGRLEGNIPLQGGVHFRGDVSSLDHCFSEIESVLPCIVEMFSLILKIFSSVFF